jgi:hypothetical protein
MPLHDLYHTGIVVRNLDGAMQEFTEAVGVRWLPTPPEPMLIPVWTPDGMQEVPFRAAYSVDGPVHLELVEVTIDGTLWSTSTDGRVHHLGYWSDDLAATSAELESNGFDKVAAGGLGDGRTLWVYHQRGNGPYIEHVSRELESYIFGGAEA